MSRTSRQKKLENLIKIAQIERKLEEEKEKGRLIDPLDPDTPALPCYFNTGCGLYSDGITALEIANGTMRLVKWSREASEAEECEEYGSGSLDSFLKEMAL
jgi:hypothetical protein